MKTTCPRCGDESSLHKDNPFRPFCSERCKLIDLGKWITESYRIATKTQEEEEDGSAPPPSECRES